MADLKENYFINSNIESMLECSKNNEREQLNLSFANIMGYLRALKDNKIIGTMEYLRELHSLYEYYAELRTDMKY